MWYLPTKFGLAMSRNGQDIEPPINGTQYFTKLCMLRISPLILLSIKMNHAGLSALVFAETWMNIKIGTNGKSPNSIAMQARVCWDVRALRLLIGRIFSFLIFQISHSVCCFFVMSRTNKFTSSSNQSLGTVKTTFEN